MILKTLTHDRGDPDCWNFYDNIESASVYYDKQIGESCIAVRYKGADSDVVLAIQDVAYLCNDTGKTIEKLLPAIKITSPASEDASQTIRKLGGCKTCSN